MARLWFAVLDEGAVGAEASDCGRHNTGLLGPLGVGGKEAGGLPQCLLSIHSTIISFIPKLCDLAHIHAKSGTWQ